MAKPHAVPDSQESAKRRSVRDIEFICKQIVRFLRMPHKERFAYLRKNKRDAFCMIPHPSGNGLLQCSFEAWMRFGLVADRIVQCDTSLIGRVEHESVKKELIATFVERVLKQGMDVNRTAIDQIFSDVCDKCRKTLHTTEHFLPCVLFGFGGPDEFSIGPVTFTRFGKFYRNRRVEFRASLSKEIEAHVQHADSAIEGGFPKDRAMLPADSRRLIRGLRAKAIAVYKKYPWVARVEIIKCDDKVAEQLARKIVATAINTIRVMLGTAYTSKLRLAWALGESQESAHMFVDTHKVIHTHVGKGSMAPVGFRNWHEGLTLGDGYELRVMGSALTKLAEPQPLRHLHQRFVDAITWFGDGATDPEPSASIVKYVSALERLLFGKFERGQTKTFAKRIDMVLRLFECDGHERSYEEATTIYRARSTLLHGISSPRDRAVNEVATVAEKLTRLSILSATQLYPMMLAAYDNPGPDELEEVMHKCERDGLAWLAKAGGFSLAKPQAH